MNSPNINFVFQDSGPPPLPPPRTESLIKDPPPAYQARQPNGLGSTNPELFEIPDRLVVAEVVNGDCEHDQEEEEVKAEVRTRPVGNRFNDLVSVLFFPLKYLHRRRY